jgi:hypothetical protein
MNDITEFLLKKKLLIKQGANVKQHIRNGGKRKQICINKYF